MSMHEGASDLCMEMCTIIAVPTCYTENNKHEGKSQRRKKNYYEYPNSLTDHHQPHCLSHCPVHYCLPEEPDLVGKGRRRWPLCFRLPCDTG